MSVVLTKTEIIGGSVDGTVRTFDMRIGRYVKTHSIQEIKVWYCFFLLRSIGNFGFNWNQGDVR